MQFIRTEKEIDTRTVNLNQGHGRDFFTKQEQEDFWHGKMEMINGCYSYEAIVHYHRYTTYIKVDREYVEKKLGLRPLLKIISKLSKGDKGALSKQLYPYYEKVGISTLKWDLKKAYKEVYYTDINDLEDRQSHSSSVFIQYGKKKYYGWGNGEEALQSLAKDHLKRCIAILADKGYIEISNSTKNRYMRGYRYTYSNTYYKLTEKAEKLLSEGR